MWLCAFVYVLSFDLNMHMTNRTKQPFFCIHCPLFSFFIRSSIMTLFDFLSYHITEATEIPPRSGRRRKTFRSPLALFPFSFSPSVAHIQSITLVVKCFKYIMMSLLIRKDPATVAPTSWAPAVKVAGNVSFYFHRGYFLSQLKYCVHVSWASRLMWRNLNII